MSIAPKRLMRSGDHAGAAAIYERLATETTGNDSVEFKLRAVRAWLAAGRAADADRVLATLPGGLTQQQTLEQGLLRMQSAVAQGRGDEAWREITRHADADGAGAGGALLRSPPAGGDRHRATWSTASAPNSRANGSIGPGDARTGAFGVVRPAARRRRTRRFAHAAAGQRRHHSRLARSRLRRRGQRPQPHAGRHAHGIFPRAFPGPSGARRAAGRAGRRHRRARREARLRAAPRAHAAARRAHVAGAGSRADPRWLHDGVLPVARQRAPAPARLRHGQHVDRRHGRGSQRGRRRVHRRPADARRSRRDAPTC